jgi:hypothetical protein
VIDEDESEKRQVDGEEKSSMTGWCGGSKAFGDNLLWLR